MVSFSPTLVSLSLFGCTNIFYEEENPGGCEDDFNPTRQVLVKDFTFEGFNRLRFLNLGKMTEGMNVENLLRPLASLTALDLSGIQLIDIVFLTQWKDSLASLVLYNMDLCEEHIQVIAKLHKLRSALRHHSGLVTNKCFAFVSLCGMERRPWDSLPQDIFKMHHLEVKKSGIKTYHCQNRRIKSTLS